MNTDTLSRRDLLHRLGTVTLGALTAPWWLPRLVFIPAGAPAAPSDILVCIFLRGAADGLNLVVPHGDKDYYAARPTLALAQPNANNTNAAIDLDGFFGLHPRLAPLKDIFDAGALALVHAVGSPDPTHSHFDAMDFIERGVPGDKSVTSGWLGRHLETQPSLNATPYRAVSIGTTVPTSLRGALPALALPSINDFRLRADERTATRTLTALAALYDGASPIEMDGKQTLAAINTLAKFPSQYTPSNNAKYPDTPFGKSLMTIAQLIKADLGLQIACADLGGWDTHVQEEGPLARLAEEFAQGLAAFYADLQDEMKRLTLVALTEFGRRVQENSNRGTDHGHGGVMFVLGGNVNGKKVYGDWPTLSKEKLYGPGDLDNTTDFRDVLGEIVSKRLGNPNLAAVFPRYQPNFRNIVRAQE